MNLNIHQHLLTGERILWQGLPLQGPRFRAADIYLIPFSLLWGGFALFWNISAWSAQGGLIFKLFGLPFLALGIYFVIGRFIHDAALRQRTTYVVTNLRVLILREARSGSSVRSFDLRHLPGVELREDARHRGSIVFEKMSVFDAANSFGYWVPSLNKGQFDSIENPRQVYDLILRTTRTA